MSRACLVLGFLAAAAPVSVASAQPTSPHPRIWLTSDVSQEWHALAGTSGSATSRAIAKCDDVRARPGEWSSGQYQGFAWVEALSACLVAWRATDDTAHRDAALVYWNALLDDRDTLGDGAGPSYAGGAGIVAQDSGYSMRTFGVWGALGYDWLYDSLSSQDRDHAHQRFSQWIAFHQQPDTYQRAQPGANYHAGHVLAMTLLAVGYADDLEQRSAGQGQALYDYVVDELWGQVMAGGAAGTRGPLVGGDWLEGWQYAPLSVASYSLAGRALQEQGAGPAWLTAWNDAVFHRYVHGLSPDDRMFVGGDADIDTPNLDVNPLPLWGVVAGVSAPATAAAARAELARLAVGGARDFQLFYECLAEAAAGPATPLDRSTEPTAWLASGAGNFYGRTAFDADAIWLVSQCKGTVVDHQHPNAGNVVLQRGADALLVDPGPYGSLSTLTGNAPTLSQPHFNDNYRPSQGAWGEESGGPLPENVATRFAFTRATRSNVLATRCDWDGQLRFQDNASQTVSDAVRDAVLLPGTSGASLVLVDRALTTAAWSSADPLLLRFHSAGTFVEQGTSASATVGGSRLLVRRVVGDATTQARATPEGDCYSGDRGKCEAARFAASEWSAEVPGPSPFAVHVLDADATGAADPAITASAQGPAELVQVDRESHRFIVVVTRDASSVAGYDTDASASTHIVLDPPAGDRVLVTASAGSTAGTCHIALAPATAPAGFESRPLVFTLDDTCTVAEETSQPPVITPGTGGTSGAGGAGGTTSGGAAGTTSGGAAGATSGGTSGTSGATPSSSDDGGCGCRTTPNRAVSAYWLVALALLLHRRTRTRSHPQAERE